MSKWEELTDKRRESLKAASAKYVREHCDRLSLNVPKGTKDRWLEAANQRGYKDLAPFIRDCVEAAISSGVDDSIGCDTIVNN